MNISILGAGTWGVALAALLSKNGCEVSVWSPIEAEVAALHSSHEHPNLRGIALPENIKYTTDIASNILKNYDVTPIAHLTCVGTTKDKIKAKLSELSENGIELNKDVALSVAARYEVSCFR